MHLGWICHWFVQFSIHVHKYPIIKKHTISNLFLWPWGLACPWPCRSNRIHPIRHSQILMSTNSHHNPAELTLRCHITIHNRTYTEEVRSVSLTKCTFSHPLRYHSSTPHSQPHTHTHMPDLIYVCLELLIFWRYNFQKVHILCILC